MSRSQLLLCFFSLSASLLVIQAEFDSENESERIVGGDDAEEGAYPYQISLQVNGGSICGGSILSKSFVITAAHCVVKRDGSFMGDSITIVAGIIDLESKSDKRVAVEVVDVFVPKEYDPTDQFKRETGDMALLKLNEDLDIEGNSNLGTVKLPNDEDTYAGKKAIISGFGWNKVDLIQDPETGGEKETGGKTYNKLRFAQANVLSNEDCQSHYSDPIDAKHICAALVQRDSKKPEGICSGDSGGPLVYEGAQIGVVSTSPLGCRENKNPAVYTRVSKFIDFIKKVVDGDIDSSIRTTTLKVKNVKKKNRFTDFLSKIVDSI